MKSTALLSLLGVLILLGCSPAAVIPNEPDIDVNGIYNGRIKALDGSTALLDVTIVETNLRVTAVVKSQDSGQVFNLSGTRSVYKASPVDLNLTQEIGSGSPCPRGSTERYAVQATFYAASSANGAGGRGAAQHQVCDSATGQFRDVAGGSGALELGRK